MARACTAALALATVAILIGCGGGGASRVGDDDDDDSSANLDAGAPDGSSPDAPSSPDAGVDAGPVDYPYSDLDVGCAPIFHQNIVPEYHVTIAPAEWDAIETEFLNPQLTPGGSIIEPGYHPAQVHIVEGAAQYDPPETAIRINGNTSWLQAIAHDPNPKMQFMISFNEVHEDSRFEGLRKLKLDMPRSDWTYLQQRVALAWLRGRAGVPAPCANNAKLFINGQYYGLYTNAERQDKGFLKRVYGGDDNDGDLWKSGRDIKTNEDTFTWTRISAFWEVEDLAGFDALVDVETSMLEWASEAIIGDSDGYNQGRPNYYLYDRPSTQEFVWLANDLDTTLDEDFLPPDTTPIFAPTPEGEGRWERDWWHYLIALNTPSAVPRYVAAMAEQYPKLDPAELRMWIDDWSAQIHEAAETDPHRPFSMANHTSQLTRMKSYPHERKEYLYEWLDCWEDAHGADADGDGFDMCHDCDDQDAAQSPAAVEVCDEIDNNCNGYVDDVAAGAPSCSTDPNMSAREAFWNRIYIDVKAQAELRR